MEEYGEEKSCSHRLGQEYPSFYNHLQREFIAEAGEEQTGGGNRPYKLKSIKPL